MISDQQSVFVSGWLIQDNSILAHEIFHALGRQKGATGSFAPKINMALMIGWNEILFMSLSKYLVSVPDGSPRLKNVRG